MTLALPKESAVVPVLYGPTVKAIIRHTPASYGWVLAELPVMPSLSQEILRRPDRPAGHCLGLRSSLNFIGKAWTCMACT